MKFAALMLSALILMSGCATAPSVQTQVVQACPVLPEMEELASELLVPSFTERMANFLQGKLPAATSYELPSRPATSNIGLRAPL